MRVQCAVDGRVFEAKRASARYCSERCRKRAQRTPKLTVLPAVPAVRTGGDSAGGALLAATRRRLDGAGRAESELGEAALLMAEHLEARAGVETGSGLAALMREYRATLAEAVKDAEGEDDALDQVRQSAALKLLKHA